MQQRETFKQQARILKALANETRLIIVERLAQGDCTPAELTALVGASQPTVSRHLALLRDNGIVEDRREGGVVYYRLLTPCVLNFLGCANDVINKRF